MANTMATIRDPQDPNKRMAVPSVKRGDDGSIEVLTNPLDSWKNQTSFLETAKEIIRRKQQYNQDISGAKQYWRSLVSDTSPFGGVREPIATKEGVFTDARMRELSPEDQASVRASRTSAINANLLGLNEEEKYRETQISDVIKSLTDMITEKNKLAKEEIDRAEQQLDIAKKKQDLGLDIDAEDLGIDSSKGIGNKIGGTVSWRHNNPLNLKYASWEDSYGATKGQAGTDGGNFAIFPTVEKAYEAYRDLLRGKAYSGLPIEQALRKWSGQGYGVSKLEAVYERATGKSMLPNWTSKKIGQLTDSEMNEMFSAMKLLEGWQEGTVIGQKKNELALTEAAKTSLMKTAGFTNQAVSGYSEDDWILLDNVIRTSLLEEASDKIGGDGTTKGWKDQVVINGKTFDKPDPELIRSKLVSEYGGRLSESEIDTIMLQSGFVKSDNAFATKWIRP